MEDSAKTFELEKKSTVLMFAMSQYSDWTKGVQNRNFHIFDQMLKDDSLEKILVVSFAPTTWRRALKLFLRELLFKGKTVKRFWGARCYQLSEKLYVYASLRTYFGKSDLENLKILSTHLNLKNRILWHYDVLNYDSYRDLKKPDDFQVFDAVDNWLEHSSYKKSAERLNKNYDNLLSDSNLILAVSRHLADYLKKRSAKPEIINFVSNASDHSLLRGDYLANQKQLKLLEGLRQKYQQVLGYIGVIQKDRLDFPLLEEILISYPEKVVVLAGPIWKDLQARCQRLADRYSNLCLLGNVHRDDWRAVANYFDLAIAPHLTGGFMSYISPTKIYEYLAVGLPVVTTPVSDVDLLAGQVLIANDPEEFIAGISDLLAGENNDKRIARQKFIADNHLWEHRYQEIKKLLK